MRMQETPEPETTEDRPQAEGEPHAKEDSAPTPMADEPTANVTESIESALEYEALKRSTKPRPPR